MYAASLPEGDENKKSIDTVFKNIAALQGVYAKSFLDLINIEDVFGVIEIGALLGRLGNMCEEEIADFKKCLEQVISFTLDSSLRLKKVKIPNGFQTRLLGVGGKSSATYSDFVLSLLQQKFKERGVCKAAILSFNYDIALDYCMNMHSEPFSYWVKEEPREGIPYLKLHGSLNWGFCEECNRIVPVSINQLYQRIRGGPEGISRLESGTIIDSLTDPKGHSLKGPVLVPPTFNKGEYQNMIRDVWQKASSVLAEAENLYVIGYSLPETDTFFRYLYAIGSFSDTRIKRIWVFNPDKTVEDRFRQLIGRGVESRFRFFPRTFGESIKIIRDDGIE